MLLKLLNTFVTTEKQATHLELAPLKLCIVQLCSSFLSVFWQSILYKPEPFVSCLAFIFDEKTGPDRPDFAEERFKFRRRTAETDASHEYSRLVTFFVVHRCHCAVMSLLIAAQ